ncbi:FKBP-type peptidyl-prolyl cis-trans isomerase [Geobacter sp. OR-1]|uniref:FKBP-type peptidyl-prolyl cis-trans isomerase n=1 Tax=Geobacter sp. OR-1 TaxID=1266765 RepID=UPI000542B802|nr:peptidylprolyl isomerase [Geobacter sp. OR-1]GAM11682.1 FKBP-type peptidyl-prolyl cis-trans isomerase [Geobacter sp. OR-1]
MQKAKQGDKVKVHYTGRLDDGEVFDSSECNDDACGCETGPLEFTIGEGNVIPGFEAAVIGMSLGESKEVKIPMNEAYGPYQEELVGVVERSRLPEGLVPEIGGQLEVTGQDGEAFPVLITEVSDTEVTLDANHPLAGRDLTFDIKLVEIG